MLEKLKKLKKRQSYAIDVCALERGLYNMLCLLYCETRGFTLGAAKNREVDS
jgi:hypothetical protein